MLDATNRMLDFSQCKCGISSWDTAQELAQAHLERRKPKIDIKYNPFHHPGACPAGKHDIFSAPRVSSCVIQWSRNRLLTMRRPDSDYVLFCFEGRALVETATGAKYIKDIRLGDFVKTHKGNLRPVLRVMKRTYREGLLRVQTPYSNFKCTPEHPLYVKRLNEPVWIKAGDLKVGDWLLYPYQEHKDTLVFGCSGKRRFGNRRTKWNEVDVTPELARYLGLYLAEGCGGDSAIRFTFGNHEHGLIKFVVDFSQQFFERKPTVYRRWATQVGINIRSVAQRFEEWFGKRAREKQVPEFVFSWNLKNKLAFIQGFMEGDGSIRRDAVLGRSASSVLASGIIALSRSCGLRSSDYKCYGAYQTTINGQSVNTGPSYTWFLNQASWGKLQDLLAGEHQDGFLAIPVKDITRAKRGNSIPVFNLEVAEDNSYIVGPAIAHNCDDDIVVEPDSLDRMLAHKVDIIAGVCTRRLDPPEPNLRQWVDDVQNYGLMLKWPDEEVLMPVDAVGTGFMLISAKAIEDIAMAYYPALYKEMGDGQWFEFMRGPLGTEWGEDVAFCWKASRIGYQVYVDNTIRPKHIGDYAYGMDDYLQYREQRIEGSLVSREQAGMKRELIQVNTEE